MLKAVLHRVSVPRQFQVDRTGANCMLPGRYSLAFFQRPGEDKSAGPIREFVTKERPAWQAASHVVCLFAYVASLIHLYTVVQTIKFNRRCRIINQELKAALTRSRNPNPDLQLPQILANVNIRLTITASFN